MKKEDLRNVLEVFNIKPTESLLDSILELKSPPLETKSIEFWIYDEPEFGKATRISLEELLDYRKKGYELEIKLIKPAIVKTVGLTIELEEKGDKTNE